MFTRPRLVNPVSRATSSSPVTIVGGEAIVLLTIAIHETLPYVSGALCTGSLRSNWGVPRAERPRLPRGNAPLGHPDQLGFATLFAVNETRDAQALPCTETPPAGMPTVSVSDTVSSR